MVSLKSLLEEDRVSMVNRRMSAFMAIKKQWCSLSMNIFNPWGPKQFFNCLQGVPFTPIDCLNYFLENVL